jgi:hypothetical protein
MNVSYLNTSFKIFQLNFGENVKTALLYILFLRTTTEKVKKILALGD